MGLSLKSVESYLLRKINVDRYLPIQLDITNACNLRCAHCYHEHHKNDGALSLSEWCRILLQYRDLIAKMRYRPAVVICGGEPMISPFLLPLLDFISRELPGATMSILTNGTLVTTKMATALKKYPRLRFQVSLDGPDADRHDLIRGKGNFARALAGIKTLQAHDFEVNVLAVLSKQTSPWMEDFFRLAVREGFTSMNFVRFVAEGYGRKRLESQQDEPLLGLELKSAYENLIRLMAAYQVKSKTQAPLFDLIIPGLGRSGKFWESIVVDYQGYIVASSRSKMRLGHAFREGIENVFLHDDIYRGLRRGRIEGCGACALLGVCGGDRNAAYAATGNFLGKDPGCWKIDPKQKQLEAV